MSDTGLLAPSQGIYLYWGGSVIAETQFSSHLMPMNQFSHHIMNVDDRHIYYNTTHITTGEEDGTMIGIGITSSLLGWVPRVGACSLLFFCSPCLLVLSCSPVCPGDSASHPGKRLSAGGPLMGPATPLTPPLDNFVTNRHPGCIPLCRPSTIAAAGNLSMMFHHSTT